MKVYQGRYQNNKSFISIVDEYYCPICPYTENYLTIHLVGSVNTRKQYAKQLKFVLIYFDTKKINIVERVQCGEFLRLAELNAFFSSCSYIAESVFSNVLDIRRFTDKALENAIHASRVAGSKVKAQTAKGRVNRLIDFLSFLYTTIYADKVVPEATKQRYDFAQQYLKEKRKTLIDFDTVCAGEGESILPTEKYLRLLEIIQPDSPDNPFQKSKLRNYLIVSLLSETGNRRGAIASLKIGDCKFWGSFDEISIVRRPDDPTNPLKIQGEVKTKPHLSYVPEALMQKLKEYIDHVRSRYPASRSHELIFISENNSRGSEGMPLTLSSLDKIFEKLSKAIGFKVHAHLLRHKKNEVFTDTAEQMGVSFEEMEKLRIYMNGWSRNTKMSELYNKFKIYQQMRAIEQARQAGMTQKADMK